MRVIFLFILGLFGSQMLLAQVTFPEQTTDSTNIPKILRHLNVKQDLRLNKMLNWHIEKNKKMNGIRGFRVEIFSSSKPNAKAQAERVKVAFMSEFPDNKVYINYFAPNFEVKVGDFRTENEAVKMHKTIKGRYPTAFVVSDNINFPLLKPLHYE